MKFKKLFKHWNGPWKIIKFKSPLVVEIEHVSKRTKHGRLSKQIVHVDRLTPCKVETVEEEDSAVEPDTDSQSIADTQDTQLDTQADSQDLFSDSLRPARTRRLPKSHEGYIL